MFVFCVRCVGEHVERTSIIRWRTGSVSCAGWVNGPVNCMCGQLTGGQDDSPPDITANILSQTDAVGQTRTEVKSML